MRTTFYTLLIVCFGLLGSWDTQAQSGTNCPPLTPFCQDLNTSYMPGACMVEVWAKDFISKINDGDTDLNDFFISFDPDELVMSQIFMSEDGKEQTVLIYIRDACGNTTICEVELDINDNTGECPDRDFAVCPIELNPWCGYAIMTCSASAEDELVATILDVRNNGEAPRGDDWAAPVGGGDTLNMIRPPSWRLGNIGQVFGMARKVETGEIFFAASDVYAFDYGLLVDQNLVSVGFPPPTATGSAGPAGIYRTMFDINQNSISISPIITTRANSYLEEVEAIGGSEIPNFGNFDGTLIDPAGATNQFERFDSMGTTTGNGLGNISYDQRSNHIFASNLEDGKIYSIDCSTNKITDVFDPFGSYDHNIDGPGIVEKSERVWGLGVRQCEGSAELYFARENTSASQIDHLTTRRKSIYKVDIIFNGEFAQSNGSEELVVHIDRGTQDKITDISFDRTCTKMLLSERGHPHKAAVLEYVNNGLGWISSQQFYVGIYDDTAPDQPGQDIVGTSSGGGSTYGPVSNNEFFDAECDQVVWSTVHCGNPVDVPGRCDVYGLQGIAVTGNDTLTSGSTDIYVGLQVDPGSSVLRLKNNLGDVDIFECCCPEGPINPRPQQMATITGTVSTSFDVRLKNTEISIDAYDNNLKVMSGIDGTYYYDKVEKYNNYKVEANFQGDILDGLTTLDLIEIQRHILGLRKLDSPYKVIAADINNSGNISTLDLIELRKVLIGAVSEFKNNKVWNFSSSEISELNNNPHDYSALIEINNLSENMLEADFVAIKTGDVNGDNSVDESSKSRSIEFSELKAKISTKNGKTIAAFYLPSDLMISGLQLSLRADEQVSQLIDGQIEMDQQFVNVINGNEINISWSGKSSQMLNSEEPLFVVELGKPNAVIKIGNTIQSELYSADLEVKNITLDVEITENSHLFTVSPNPTSGEARLKFYSQSLQEGDLIITTIDGRGIYKSALQIEKGLNEIALNFSQILNTYNGIALIQIKSNEMAIQTKALIVK